MGGPGCSFRIFATLMLFGCVLAHSSCTSSEVGVGTGDPIPEPGFDALVGNEPGDVGGPGADVSGDTTEPEPPPDLAWGNCEDGGEPGCPCEENLDCFSEYCVTTGDGSLCSKACEANCPNGWQCKDVASGGGDLTFICVPLYTNLCRPCETGEDCEQLGGVGGYCLPTAEGSFCGGNCDDDTPCPEGYECTDAQLGEMFTVKQCQPVDGGECTCNVLATKDGASTTCSSVNSEGSCDGGERMCTPDGLTACDAPEPTEETCDGIDNDCDGAVDEASDDSGNPSDLGCDANGVCGILADGSPGCVCEAGYAGDGTTCEDIDECTEELDDCHEFADCTNTSGSFECSCLSGFVGDGVLCADSDECAEGLAECHLNATCENIEGSYSCTCNTGYEGDGLLCEDSDECDPNPCQNAGTCTDGVAVYACECVAGFSGDLCETNVNECDPNPCQNGGACADGLASYTCACVPGYEGESCEINVNDCDPEPCQNGGTCADGVNTFTCACAEGYEGETCETNSDECATGAANCHGDAFCTDTVDGFICTCNAGFTGDGTTCADIDECTTGAANCHGDALCTNSVGGFSCTCNAGFTGDGYSCVDINECSVGSDNCHPSAVCANTAGSFTCTCNVGFTGNGTSCSTCGAANCADPNCQCCGSVPNGGTISETTASRFVSLQPAPNNGTPAGTVSNDNLPEGKGCGLWRKETQTTTTTCVSGGAVPSVGAWTAVAGCLVDGAWNMTQGQGQVFPGAELCNPGISTCCQPTYAPGETVTGVLCPYCGYHVITFTCPP